MRSLIILFGVSIGGAIGWWIGYNIGIFTALVLSSIGSGLGLYFIRKIVPS